MSTATRNNIRVRADVFPASVSFSRPGGGDAQPETYDKTRVIVTMDTLFVYKDGPRGPELVFSERLQDFDPGVPIHRRTRATPQRSPRVVTDSGIEVTYARGGSCGCGSRLKSFNPFQQMASTADR